MKDKAKNDLGKTENDQQHVQELSELDRAHATIRRLNRRVQSAEAGLAEKINANKGQSLGRILAISAATMYAAQLEDLRATLPTSDEATFILDGLLLHAPGWRIPDALLEKLKRLTESVKAAA
jgi:hypothetical protein